MELNIPAIQGPGGSHFSFVDVSRGIVPCTVNTFCPARGPNAMR